MVLQIIYQMREQLIVNSLYEVEACGYGVSSVASVSGGLAAEPVDELVLVADEQIEAALGWGDGLIEGVPLDGLLGWGFGLTGLPLGSLLFLIRGLPIRN